MKYILVSIFGIDLFIYNINSLYNKTANTN